MSQPSREIFLMQECVRQGALGTYIKSADVIHCPSDTRYKRPVGNGFSYGSVAGVDGMDGQEWPSLTLDKLITRRTQVMHPSERLLWVEENDPRGENWGTWVMNFSGTQANDFAGTTFVDSPAVFHGQSSTFSWSDGHVSARRWVDGATVAYAADSNVSGSKYSNPPSAAKTADDIAFMRRAYGSKLNP